MNSVPFALPSLRTPLWMKLGLSLLFLLMTCVAACNGTETSSSASASTAQRFFFTSSGKTGIVGIDGSGLSYFDFQVPGQATWQPGPSFSDGRRVIFLSMEPRRDGPGRPFAEYYTQTPTHIWSHDLTDGSLNELCTQDRIAPFQTPALLLGDERLLVQVIKDKIGRIVSMRLDGTDAQDFTKAGEGLPYGFSLSPDQTRIAFHLAGGSGYQIMTSDVRGGDRKILAGAAGHLFFGTSWSPNGDKVLYVDCQPGTDPGHDWADLCTANPDGTGHQVLTSGNAMWFAATYGPKENHGSGSNLPAWTHDGKILFPRRAPDSLVPWQFRVGQPDLDHFNRDFRPDLARGGVCISRLDPQTGTITDLTEPKEGRWDFRASESPDGKYIVFCRAATGESPTIWVMNSDGTNARPVTQGIDNQGADHPRWLPTSQPKTTGDELSVELPETDDTIPGAGPIRRQEWFLNVWKEQRTKFAQNNAADQKSLVFLGDSITQGWGTLLADSFPEIRMANRGISGDTTRGMLLRLPQDVLSLNPSGVVMMMGTNDLQEKADPSVIAGNLRLMIAALKKQDPQMPIVLCLIFPSSAKADRPSAAIKEINRQYQEVVKGDPQITVIDTWTLFAGADGDAPAELFPDLVHLNEAGYRKWAAALRPTLATLGFTDWEPDQFTVEAGFRPLFNGKDLTGWGLRPTSAEDLKARERWQKSDPQAPPWPVITDAVPFDGLTASSDNRYRVINGRLVVTAVPEGRRIQQLWTTEDFTGDFVLRLEFRAAPNADSGVFLKKPQLQCRDYLVAGPYKNLKSYRPQEWNELEVTVTGNTARCTCNGEILEESFKVPESGPIGLEGDRGQMEYRRIRINTEKRQ